MTPGRLRHRVLIQARATTSTGAPLQDRSGQEVISWINGPTVYADVKPSSGREQVNSEAVQSVISHVVTIRYRTGVTAKNRLLYGGRVLEILAVVDVDERHRWLELTCSEGQTQG